MMSWNLIFGKGGKCKKQEPIVPLLITQNSNISTQNTTKAREKKRKKIKKCLITLSNIAFQKEDNGIQLSSKQGTILSR